MSKVPDGRGMSAANQVRNQKATVLAGSQIPDDVSTANAALEVRWMKVALALNASLYRNLFNLQTPMTLREIVDALYNARVTGKTAADLLDVIAEEL